MPEGARVPAKEAVGAIEKSRSVDPAPDAHAHQRPRTMQAQLLHYQRTVGNQAVQKLIRSGLAQPAARPDPLTQRQPAQPEEASQQPDRQAAAAEPKSITPAISAAISPTRISSVTKQASNAPHIQTAWYNFDIPFTDYQFDPSLSGIKTAANVVKDTAVAGFDWVVDEIKGLVSSGIDWLTDKWDSIQEFASSAFDAAKNSFTNIVGFIKSPLGFLSDALMSLDAQALAKAWAAFSGLISTVANGFKAMTDNLLGQVNKVWSGINGFATSLLNRVAGLTENFLFNKLPSALQKVAFSVIDRLKSLWKSINDGWNNLFKKIKAWVDGALDTVFGFVRRVLSFGINVVIAGIVEFGKIVLFLKDLFSNPHKYIEQLAKRSVQAFDGVEGRFAGVLGQYFGSAKSAPPAQAGGSKIDRSPASQAPAETKGSASWGEIGHGVGEMMGKKWNEFKSNPMAIVTGLLMDLVLPMVGNVKDVVQLFKDIKKIVTGPLGAGSLEELWTSLLQILEIPILIYHTIVSILMRSLMLPLIVATFIPHPLVKAIAAAVGEGLLAAFVEAEGLTLAQKLLLLKTGATDKAQKEEAYNRIADSLIALAMTAVIIIVMLILHFIASVMKGVYNFVKGKVFTVEAPPTEGRGAAPGDGAPDSNASRETVPDSESKKGVAAEGTVDGHKIKVMDDGRIFVCTTCEEIEFRYREQLEADTPEAKGLQAELAEAKKLPNGQAKVDAVEAIKRKLDAQKERVDSGGEKSGEPAEPAEPIDSAGGKSAKELAREATLEQIEKVKQERLKNKAGLERLSEEISKARGEVRRLKEKVESSSGDARAEALKEFRAAKDVLEDSEGSGLLDEQRGYLEEKTKLADREARLNESLKLDRPPLREATKAAIEKAAERAPPPDGRFLDANTKKPIDGPAHFGHKYGFEHRRLALEAQAKGMSQAQFADWVNAHPEWFQIESEASNLSHAFEKPGID